jgi:hypothetical protein
MYIQLVDIIIYKIFRHVCTKYSLDFEIDLRTSLRHQFIGWVKLALRCELWPLGVKLAPQVECHLFATSFL